MSEEHPESGYRLVSETGLEVVCFLFPGILHDVKNIFSRLKLYSDFGYKTENAEQKHMCLEGIREKSIQGPFPSQASV